MLICSFILSAVDGKSKVKQALFSSDPTIRKLQEEMQRREEELQKEQEEAEARAAASAAAAQSTSGVDIASMVRVARAATRYLLSEL
jgi:Skp family chaperone for outer membrane proteins